MTKRKAVPPTPTVSLGDNPVNNYQAREYAKESSPSSVAVIIELTENARDNGTNVTLTIDVESSRKVENHTFLVPRRIICQDNGTGLRHDEFLEQFCGAFSESQSHHEIDRAGRNGVGTKTYLSIAEKVIVTTTTGRPTQGLDDHAKLLRDQLPEGLELPSDGQPDTVNRVYEFHLHKRSALPTKWKESEPLEMGTKIELVDLLPGTEIQFDNLIERLSYTREWLKHSSNTLTVQLTGNVPEKGGKPRRINVHAWEHPTKNWLTKVQSRSDRRLKIWDPTAEEDILVEPIEADLDGLVEFDMRVIGKNAEGQPQNLDKPVLLLEVCGALPYAPNLEAGTISARTLPLLTFLGLEHSSSIGAFCNAVTGHIRIDSLKLKMALRNNKTTLASGPGADAAESLKSYLQKILKVLHRAWYNATRASQDAATRDAVKEAQEEVNLALKGVTRNPFQDQSQIEIDMTREPRPGPLPRPPRRHRWECGECGKRWLAMAGFTPGECAEIDQDERHDDGCGSSNIGLGKNQPRIGDCQIRVEPLGDRRIPASFQFERPEEDLELPVVTVNLASPRYIELRGTGPISGQGQKRLKQYLVDVSLTAIAEHTSQLRGTTVSVELGDLYFNRMLRFSGIKKCELQLEKVLESVNPETETKHLLAS